MKARHFATIAIGAIVVVTAACRPPAGADVPFAQQAQPARAVLPAGPAVEDVNSDALLPPAKTGEARLEIQVRFPPRPDRQVEVVPLGSAMVVVTLSGGPLAQPVVATVTPPPSAGDLGARVFTNLQQGPGYSLAAEAQNENGVTLARSFQSNLSLLSGANSVGITMTLTGTAGQVNF